MRGKTHRPTTPAAPPRRRPRALPLLALLMVGAGLLRLGDGTGAAVAREVAALGADLPDPAPQPSAICDAPPDLQTVLDGLAAREERLARREAALNERAADLDRAGAEMQAQLAKLVAAEEDLARTLALADQAAEGDVAQLTQVYENMKPKEAAALFETMAPGFAAGFLARMSPQASARIMAGLSPDAAYSISVTLAGRHTGVPTE